MGFRPESRSVVTRLILPEPVVSDEPGVIAGRCFCSPWQLGVREVDVKQPKFLTVEGEKKTKSYLRIVFIQASDLLVTGAPFEIVQKRPCCITNHFDSIYLDSCAKDIAKM